MLPKRVLPICYQTDFRPRADRGGSALFYLRDCRFPAQNWGGRRQFDLLWWQALGRIFAEERSNVFVYEPGGRSKFSAFM
jgi:hypothetical protein